MGLNKEERIIPSVEKHWAIFNSAGNIMRWLRPFTLLQRYRLLTFNPLLDRRGEEKDPAARARGVLPLGCASVLNCWQIDAKSLRGRGGVPAGIDGGRRLKLAFREKSCQRTSRGGDPQFFGQADLAGFAPGLNRFFESLGHSHWV